MNYKAMIIKTKCEKCGEEHSYLIPTDKIEPYLNKKENTIISKLKNIIKFDKKSRDH